MTLEGRTTYRVTLEVDERIQLQTLVDPAGGGDVMRTLPISWA
ncbi:MAG: hypothetical protein OXC53_10800 [Rhodobacteraceae bacterium]|nr:hypothetical protein [Paracoccaceae bacterium]